jgi:hypothetical protein
MSKALEIAELGNSLTVDGSGNITFSQGLSAATISGNGSLITSVDAETLDGLNSTDFDSAGSAVALAIALG